MTLGSGVILYTRVAMRGHFVAMPDISDFKGQIDSYKTARDALFVALFCSSKIPDCWFQRRDGYKQLHRNIS